ncbi:STY1053 family phage-associated protein [Xenorhabdus griffiniae]|nr:hypothetical protein [Xenorhabdus griffiniae]
MKIRVHTPFRFTHDNGESQAFTVGNYDVSESVAQHWFVQAHAETIGAVEDTVQDDHEAIYTELREIIAERDNQLVERGTQIAELKQQLEERDTRIDELVLGLAKPNQTNNTGGKNGGNKK